MKPAAWAGTGDDGVVDIAERRDIADQWISDGLKVEPLVTLSAANAAIEERDKRIAELEAENEKLKRERQRVDERIHNQRIELRWWQDHFNMHVSDASRRRLVALGWKWRLIDHYRQMTAIRSKAAKAAEARAASLEAMVVEAGKALEPFASGKHEMRNTHLLEWLAEGFTHCKYGSEEWAQSYLNSAMDYITAFEDAARSIAAKIGGRND